ncbi:hypothetical protein BGZ54_002482 [Gamsiella multidivaricata]|nr:hypothetical protein BGZ54_002482 [Gamsiella multidivaricata]
MTASAPASAQAQVKDIAQSHIHHYFYNQHQHQYQSQQIQSSSPTMSVNSVPSPQQHTANHIYTLDQHQEQQHHHMQILGNHPASPGSTVFMDLPVDPFLPTRASNFLFSDCDSPMATATAPSAEDCQASHEYMYAHQPTSVKTEFSNDQFAAIAPTYMMAMARSFSESQLSGICGTAVAGVVSVATAADMCDSPLMYAQQGIYEDEYHYANQHQHHHHHSYSTSSLSALSDDSSLSPRSTSSSTLSLSSYPLSRTLSEPTMTPLFHQGLISASSSASDLAVGNESDTSPVKPTPKRSRGRRVSSHPDNSGCKVFTCRFDDCGKIFKRSEHLKRHVRSIHTLEKPFPCPIHNCPKRFSRSDNLNQHIRIHRHSNATRATDKNSKAFAAFTPFLQTYSTDLLTL